MRRTDGHTLKCAFACRAVKYLHATLQSLVGALIILGLVFIEEFKTRSHEVHFFSLHSWIGIVSIALYFGQYISGTNA